MGWSPKTGAGAFPASEENTVTAGLGDHCRADLPVSAVESSGGSSGKLPQTGR